MQEIWIAKIIKLKERDDWNKVLLDFVKPTIETAENEKLLDTFHFFFEPELHFRIRPKKPGMVNRIEEIISENAERMKDMIEIKPTPYSGEQPNYGKEGWACAQKFFEIGSRFSLLKRETLLKYKAELDPKKREEILKSSNIVGDFNESKFVHCFLNQVGYDSAREALFHQERAVQNLIKYVNLHYKDLDKRLKQVEEHLKK